MKLKKEFLLHKMAGENVAIPFGDDNQAFQGLVKLNDTAVFLWQMLQQECTKEQLLYAVLENYEVDQNTAIKAIDMFLNELKTQDLIILE